MKSSVKNILIGLLLMVAVGAVVGYFVYNQPHENIQRVETDHTLSATRLYSEFETDETAANEKYLGKMVQVSGTVASLSRDEDEQITVTLDGGGLLGGVICKSDNFSDDGIGQPDIGSEITLKGRCTGMLMDVVLVRCVRVAR